MPERGGGPDPDDADHRRRLDSECSRGSDDVGMDSLEPLDFDDLRSFSKPRQ